VPSNTGVHELCCSVAICIVNTEQQADDIERPTLDVYDKCDNLTLSTV